MRQRENCSFIHFESDKNKTSYSMPYITARTSSSSAAYLSVFKAGVSAAMDYLSVLFQLFVGVCMVSGLNLLADIATSLRGLNRRDMCPGVATMLHRIREALDKTQRV